jgi:hypothetical protein
MAGPVICTPAVPAVLQLQMKKLVDTLPKTYAAINGYGESITALCPSVKSLRAFWQQAGLLGEGRSFCGLSLSLLTNLLECDISCYIELYRNAEVGFDEGAEHGSARRTWRLLKG